MTCLKRANNASIQRELGAW